MTAAPDLVGVARRALEAYQAKEPLYVTPEEFLAVQRAMDADPNLWDQALMTVMRADLKLLWSPYEGRTIPVVVGVKPPLSFICPRCAMESFHPQDIEQGYCGACCDFTG